VAAVVAVAGVEDSAVVAVVVAAAAAVVRVAAAIAAGNHNTTEHRLEARSARASPLVVFFGSFLLCSAAGEDLRRATPRR
jgi:hypothetical protein